MRIILGALAVCAALPYSAHAGPFQYDCEVAHVHHIEKGQARERKGDYRQGQRFTISRESGEMVGSGAYRLSRDQGWKVFQVVDRGSNQQAFKLLAISQGPFTNVAYVTVKEYEEGDHKTFRTCRRPMLWRSTCLWTRASSSGSRGTCLR
jgi:hypothetical protein